MSKNVTLTCLALASVCLACSVGAELGTPTAPATHAAQPTPRAERPPASAATSAQDAPTEASPPVAAEEACGPQGKEIKHTQSANMKCLMNPDGSTDHVGKVATFTCPAFKASPRFAHVHGSDPFAHSSSICHAAAFAGKIKAESGGVVKIKILEPRGLYPADGVKNGEKSQSWENDRNPGWGYTFVD